MAKNTRIRVRTKRTLTQKERNQILKMESAYKAARSGENNPHNYKCPKCKKIMDCINLGIYGKKQRRKYMISCEECKLKGYIREEEDGSFFLLGSPADILTRAYRREAHYYLWRICQFGIFPDMDAAYEWLNDQFYGTTFETRGIGEFDKAFCMRAIEACVRCLINNKHRIRMTLTPYHNDYGNSYSDTSPIIKKMFEEYYNEKLNENDEVSKG